MKYLITFLLILISFYSNAQVVITKIVRVPNSSSQFLDNLPAFTKIINQATYKEYLVIQPLPSTRTLSTCIMNVDIVESGIGSYKYSNDSIGTTFGYVNLARFYSTLLTKTDKSITINGHNLTTSFSITKSDLSLSNVDNTSDISKPISTTMQDSLNTRQRLLGYIPYNSSNPSNYISIELDPSIYSWAKSPTKPSYTKSEIGLSNVTNNEQWYTGNHPYTFAGYGLTGGTLTSSLIGTELRMVGEPGFATADFFSYNGDDTGVYGVSVISYTGANRKLFKVGFDAGDDGLNIDWVDSISRFNYKFNAGDINLDGKISAKGANIEGYTSIFSSDGLPALGVWTLNNDETSNYGLNVVGSNGDDNRKIFRAGVYGVSNGFTVDWLHVTSKFVYNFSAGVVTMNDVTVLGNMPTPPTALIGGIYYNTSDNHFYGYNGTIWTQLDN